MTRRVAVLAVLTALFLAGAAQAAEPFDPLPTCIVLTEPQLAYLQTLIDGGMWDGKPLGNVLTLYQSQRFFLLSQWGDKLRDDIRAGRAAPLPIYNDDLSMPGHDLLVASMGQAGAAEYEADLTILNAVITAAQRAELATRPITGPSRYSVPGDSTPEAVRAQEGVDPRGAWLVVPDDRGGRTAIRISDVKIPQQGLNANNLLMDSMRAAAIAKGADPAPYGTTREAAAAFLSTVPAPLRSAFTR